MGWKRAIPIFVVLAVFAVFALWNGHDLRDAIHLLRTARPLPVLFAFAFQALYYLFAALTVSGCLRLVDFEMPFPQTLRATFLLIFVSRIVPGPAATGPAAMYIVLGRRGLSKTKAAFVGPLFYAVDYAGFFLLLFVGVLGAAFRHQDVRAAAAAIPVVVLALAIALAAMHVWQRPERAQGVLERFRNSGNRFLPERLQMSAQVPRQVAAELIEMRARVTAHPGIAPQLAAAGTAMLLCDVATMACCFVAFGFSPSVATAILGFCLATVGAIVSVLPGGLGTFEVAMVLGFVGLGAPKPVAVAATVVYRVIATWLPAALGLSAAGELTTGANRER